MEHPADEKLQQNGFCAEGQNRTGDTWFFRPLRYQLSYLGGTLILSKFQPFSSCRSCGLTSKLEQWSNGPFVAQSNWFAPLVLELPETSCLGRRSHRRRPLLSVDHAERVGAFAHDDACSLPRRRFTGPETDAFTPQQRMTSGGWEVDFRTSARRCAPQGSSRFEPAVCCSPIARSIDVEGQPDPPRFPAVPELRRPQQKPDSSPF